jgi:hypothetical protein
MNEARRALLWSEIELLTSLRDRVKRIRDDEDHARRGSPRHGHGSEAAADLLSEASLVLLIVINKLEKARQQ